MEEQELPFFKRHMDEKNLLCTIQKLANYLNITQKRIYQLIKSGAISPPDEKKKFIFLKAVKEYIVFLQRLPNRTSSEALVIQKAKARKEEANADIAEIQAEEMKKKIVFQEDIKEEMESLFTNFRSRLLLLPPAIASQGLGVTKYKELKDLVEKGVFEALEELSRYEPRT